MDAGNMLKPMLARGELLSHWIDEVFEDSDQGLVLRDGGEEEINGFLVDVVNVTEELKKDDF